MKTDYVWEGLYEAAILETDDGKLQQRIQAAKGAIDARLHEIQLDMEGRSKNGRLSPMRFLV